MSNKLTNVFFDEFRKGITIEYSEEELEAFITHHTGRSFVKLLKRFYGQHLNMMLVSICISTDGSKADGSKANGSKADESDNKWYDRIEVLNVVYSELSISHKLQNEFKKVFPGKRQDEVIKQDLKQLLAGFKNTFDPLHTIRFMKVNNDRGSLVHVFNSTESCIEFGIAATTK